MYGLYDIPKISKISQSGGFPFFLKTQNLKKMGSVNFVPLRYLRSDDQCLIYERTDQWTEPAKLQKMMIKNPLG